jgi:hypothetical protein
MGRNAIQIQEKLSVPEFQKHNGKEAKMKLPSSKNITPWLSLLTKRTRCSWTRLRTQAQAVSISANRPPSGIESRHNQGGSKLALDG